jgi:hypothetical protein
VPEMIQSLRSIRNRLTAVYSAAQSGGPALPAPEIIAPNQHSWSETAARMGVKHGQKRKAAPGNSISAANCIGEINRKRARACGDPRQDELRDPYGGGEKSGARAKDDARSAAANASTRAAAAPGPSLSGLLPLRSSLPRSQFPPARPIPAPSQPQNTQCPPVNYMYSYPSSAFYFPNTQ